MCNLWGCNVKNDSVSSTYVGLTCFYSTLILGEWLTARSSLTSGSLCFVSFSESRTSCLRKPPGRTDRGCWGTVTATGFFSSFICSVHEKLHQTHFNRIESHLSCFSSTCWGGIFIPTKTHSWVLKAKHKMINLMLPLYWADLNMDGLVWMTNIRLGVFHLYFFKNNLNPFFITG